MRQNLPSFHAKPWKVLRKAVEASEDDPQREAEQAVAPVESHGNGLCIACIVYGFVGDILGNVENADVVLEVEKDAGDAHAHAEHGADVERIEPFCDFALGKVGELHPAFLFPNVLETGACEEIHFIRECLYEIVAIDHREVYGADSGVDACINGSCAGAFRGVAVKGDFALADAVAQFGLQEVALEVCSHEHRAGIAHLVIVLHAVDAGIFNPEAVDEING